MPTKGTDFCVGDWIVRPKRCSIEHEDESVRIKPKSMAVLECLARAAGEVVSRNELFDAVWPGAIVSDDVLTHSVVELRKAFGDSARDAQVIETIPKNGFRLIPPVTPETNDLVSATISGVEVDDSDGKEKSRPSIRILLISAFVILIALTLFL